MDKAERVGDLGGLASPSGILFVVSSHLGNPADLSPRAVATLRDADVILAEDTRTARALLAAHGIDKPTHSCFDANEAARAVDAAAWLQQGRKVALLSEAGTPTVSDPGFRIVRAAIEVGARVIPVPGPSAVLAALVASGLPTDRFFFAGFPPRRPGARRVLFDGLRALPATLVFYESPHRVAATLADLAANLGSDRPACVARELTKTHEELVRGSLAELAARYAGDRPLGEITLVVAGAGGGADPASADGWEEHARVLLAEGRTGRDVADLMAARTGRPRRDIYRAVLALAKLEK